MGCDFVRDHSKNKNGEKIVFRKKRKSVWTKELATVGKILAAVRVVCVFYYCRTWGGKESRVGPVRNPVL